jgi:hypothetical protein
MTMHRRATGVGRHLVTDHRSVHRAFPVAVLKRIEGVIAAGEHAHTGQVRFAVEGGLPFAHLVRGEDPRERALDVFSRLRVWDTEANSGVLVYVLLADKDVEIVADRGIHRRVGDATWKTVCKAMEVAFRERRFEDGAIAGIEAINALLTQHFPRTASGPNELPDQAVVL